MKLGISGGWLTIAENAFPAIIDELAHGGELADVEAGQWERQATAAVVEDELQEKRKVGFLVISPLKLRQDF